MEYPARSVAETTLPNAMYYMFVANFILAYGTVIRVGLAKGGVLYYTSKGVGNKGLWLLKINPSLFIINGV